MYYKPASLLFISVVNMAEEITFVGGCFQFENGSLESENEIFGCPNTLP